jgi:hypothetical protein
VDEVIIPGRDDANEVFKRFASQYDAPAYMRRARQVQRAYDDLRERCRRRRDEMLRMVCTRLGTLRALAGEWERLRGCLADEQHVESLKSLFDLLQPKLRLEPAVTRSLRTLRRELAELRESIDRFNRRWPGFLESIDLTALNALRDGYNRYYVLEKECALRSPRLARQGFQRLEPLTLDDLAREFPLLPLPRLSDE